MTFWRLAAIAWALELPISAMAEPPQAKPAAAKTDAPSSWRSYIRVSRQPGQFTEDATQLRPGGFSLNYWHRWFSIEDMPPEYRANTFRATSFLALDLDTAGAVTGCRILKSAGDTRLDAVSCTRLRERGRFPLVYSAPRMPVAQKINVSVDWQTIARVAIRESAGRASWNAPPPSPDTSEYTAWPRRKWEPGLAITAFPDLAAAYPPDARKAKGKTSLELTVLPEVGATACVVGVSSGNASLDAASCRIAMTLPLAYPQLCNDCQTRRLPLQFVWDRKDSHIRVPLPLARGLQIPGQPTLVSIPRDPADTRKANAYRSQPSLRRPAIFAEDFADIADRTMSRKSLKLVLGYDKRGQFMTCAAEQGTGNAAIDARVCQIFRKRATNPPVEDVFGDPVSGIDKVFVVLDRIL